MKTMEGLATSSTAIVSRFRCSTLSPETPGLPTNASFIAVSSTRSEICNNLVCPASQCHELWKKVFLDICYQGED